MQKRDRIKLIGAVSVVFALLFGFSAMLYLDTQRANVQLAAAKGKQMVDMNSMAESPINEELLSKLNIADTELLTISEGSDIGFVSALPLSLGEARQWQDEGCLQETCAHLLYYDYANGGTISAIVRMVDSDVIAQWKDPAGRPAGSSSILPRAMAIAAGDSEVRSLLGDIGSTDPAMVPMSGWLADDECRDDWCVDLTYHDPEGSGRILHIFVNLEQREVSRIFYTRGREDRSLAKPLSQRDAYRNGCHQQYDWEVCWEMTAHDGINFRDASYDGQLIFSSAKVTQVEAWYPAWPGGYRDEIGFAASVPPVGGTEIVDLANGFEVRQLFTEFTYWPNCICCYRYEEIIRFFADGSLEFEFVSHGPGCDDIPLYRPFWRIDLDLSGPDGDEVWYWQEDKWVEATEEIELHPFVSDVSPDGEKVATFDGDLNYRWKMLLTDPLGRDESRFFILEFNDSEGEGPVITGPGDTYRPPRQWIDGDVPSGGNIVFWFVPTLAQLKGEPWWCMPDPEPDFSPCNVILRAEPGGELRQPTIEELDQARPTATATPSPTPPAVVGKPQATPTATPSPSPSPTPRPLEGEDAETIILGAGCTSCHAIGSIGERHKVGPDLSGIGLIAGERVPGMPAEDFLRQSIVEPNAALAPSCPNGPCLPNIMPSDYGTRLSNEQIGILVAFLLEQRAEVSPPATIGDQAESQQTPFPKAFPAPKRLPGRQADSTASLAIQLMLLSIVFLLTVFRLLKIPSEDEDTN